jgi:hypothetical protein
MRHDLGAPAEARGEEGSIVDEVSRVDRGDDAEVCETRQIGTRDDLRVLDAMGERPRARRALQRIESQADGAISDRVNGHRPALAGPGANAFVKGLCVHPKLPAVPRVVGVGPGQGRRACRERAVEEDLDPSCRQDGIVRRKRPAQSFSFARRRAVGQPKAYGNGQLAPIAKEGVKGRRPKLDHVVHDGHAGGGELVDR